MKISSKTINDMLYLNRVKNLDREQIHQVNKRFLEQGLPLTDLLAYHRKLIDNMMIFGMRPEFVDRNIFFLTSNLMVQISQSISYSNKAFEKFVICDMPAITIKVEIARFSNNTIYHATLSIPGWENYLSDVYTPDQIAKIIIDLATGRSHANVNQLS